MKVHGIEEDTSTSAVSTSSCPTMSSIGRMSRSNRACRMGVPLELYCNLRRFSRMVMQRSMMRQHSRPLTGLTPLIKRSWSPCMRPMWGRVSATTMLALWPFSFGCSAVKLMPNSCFSEVRWMRVWKVPSFSSEVAGLAVARSVRSGCAGSGLCSSREGSSHQKLRWTSGGSGLSTPEPSLLALYFPGSQCCRTSVTDMARVSKSLHSRMVSGFLPFTEISSSERRMPMCGRSSMTLMASVRPSNSTACKVTPKGCLMEARTSVTRYLPVIEPTGIGGEAFRMGISSTASASS
mmetsp:Transcript_102957/g.266196  ORF Transcript_102957/g.266196 Transcript_102957/m.266196 type:complete len:293 (+) Transcript_102957:96-974(+)